MSDKITDKDIEHAIRNCHWRLAVNGQRNLHLCGGACNVCEHLIESGKCDTLQRLFRQFDKEHGYQGKMLTIEIKEGERREK